VIRTHRYQWVCTECEAGVDIPALHDSTLRGIEEVKAKRAEVFEQFRAAHAHCQSQLPPPNERGVIVRDRRRFVNA
jgi:hypothetical protein